MSSPRVALVTGGFSKRIIEPAAIRSEWADIAAESMLDTAKGGACEDQARKAAAAFARTYGPAMSSGPSVVGNAIAKAATARRPKTRYPVGKGARTIVASRRMLPDRVFDRVVPCSPARRRPPSPAPPARTPGGSAAAAGAGRSAGSR